MGKSGVSITEIQYQNYGKCIKLENAAASVVITADVGPRVISYCVNGMENMLFNDLERKSTNQDPGYEEYYGKGKKWYIYGGHRLWFSPEAFPGSYYPDNDPVAYTIGDGYVDMTPPPQTENGVAYSFRFALDSATAKFTIAHSITCLSETGMEIAPWGLTVMDQGGVEIVPQCQKQTGLLSNRRLVIWPYVDLYDNRLFIGNKFITLKQDPGCPPAIKIGVNNEDGWVAYLNKGQLFTKRFAFVEGAKYPDFEVNYETYTNNVILEMETLGVLAAMRKGDTARHEEVWEVIPCKEGFDCRDEKSIEAFVGKYIG